MQAEAGNKNIGILDIHGSVEEHANALRKLGTSITFVKLPEDLEDVTGLIIPGGESTTMSKLLKKYNLHEAITNFSKRGGIIWGSCAGAILLGRCRDPKVKPLSLIDLDVERNAYGRQLDSFESTIIFNDRNIPGVFIRAPKIYNFDKDIIKLAHHQEETVAARKNNIIVSTFHPELTEDLSFHKYFLESCKIDKLV